jgi:hypothetical protein
MKKNLRHGKQRKMMKKANIIPPYCHSDSPHLRSDDKNESAINAMTTMDGIMTTHTQVATYVLVVLISSLKYCRPSANSNPTQELAEIIYKTPPTNIYIGKCS